MSNTSKGKGKKGSKFWMDTCVENIELKEVLDSKIGDVLTWVSPLASEDYAEYELKQCNEMLGLGKDEIKRKFSFWPSRGKSPQWDGIAIGDGGKTLYLFEAKAHLAEVESGKTFAEGSNRDKIIESMKQIHDCYYSEGDFEYWKSKYYQIGNRLTFLHKLQEMELEKFDGIKLVFLNFVNDRTNNKATSLESWKKYMDEVFVHVIGHSDLPEDILEVFLDVSNYHYLYGGRNNGSF